MINVSAVIPTYNRSALLREAVEAVRGQSRPVHEILILDDGSTDDTAAVVAALGGGIRYVRQENRGKSAALNNALGHVTGNFIWICDDDDVALPTAMETLAGAIEKNGADFSFGQLRKFHLDPATGERVLAEHPDYWPDLGRKTIWVKMLEDFFMYQNATLVAKAAYDAVGPFREDLVRSQDYEMALRLARCFTGVAVPQVVFLQRQHAGHRGSGQDSFSSARAAQKWIQYNQVFFRELHGSLPLSSYLPQGVSSGSTDADRRLALLQRATVFARKKLWDLAHPDLRAAATIDPARGLSRLEIEVCGAALVSGYGCRELLEDTGVAAGLRAVADQGGLGRAIVQAVTEPLLWHAKNAVRAGRYHEAAAFVAALRDANGWGGLPGLVRSVAGRKLPFLRRNAAGAAHASAA